MSSVVPTAAGLRAGALLARRTWRRRWASILLLATVAAAGAAVSVATFAGAQRSYAAYRRLSDATLAADAVVFASQVGVYEPDWTPIIDLPYVEAAGSFGLIDCFVEGPHGEEAGLFATTSGSWRELVDRPVMAGGRRADPARADEAVASASAAAAGFGVGAEVTVRCNTPEQTAAADYSEPQGPTVTVTVVGVGTSTFETTTIPLGDEPTLFVTPAFYERYGRGISPVSNLLVRFRPGTGGVAALERDARAHFAAAAMPVLDEAAIAKRVTNATNLEGDGLMLFGASVAIATLVLVGQALARMLRTTADEAVVTLDGLGMSRRDVAVAVGAPFLVTGAVAAVAGALGAVVLSDRFPIGLSRTIDPDVGRHADWSVLAGGVLVTVVAFSSIAAVAAWRVSGASWARRTRGARRQPRSALAAALDRAGAPVPMVLGARLAFEPGRGSRALPTRSALAGAVFGLVGVVGGFTLAAGIADAVAHPARAGTVWDLEATWYGDGPTPGALLALHDDPDVVASADVWRGIVPIDGVTQPLYAYEPRRGDFQFVALAGRVPRQPGEVALGPATAARSGVAIGDAVTATPVSGPRTAGPADAEVVAPGDTSPVRLHVVGLVLLPQTPHTGYDEGALVSFDQLAAINPANADASRPAVLAELAPGVSFEAKAAALTEHLDTALAWVSPPTAPNDLRSLHEVHSLPTLFAVFAALLAVITTAHATVSVVRHRRLDLAVTRSLGMTPRQARFTVAWQATAIAAVGSVAGVPLGVIAGQSAWRAIANVTPLVYVGPLAVAATALAAPLALLAANLVAAWPARRAAHLDAAAVLRTE